MQETESIDEYILQHIDPESDYLKALYRDTHVKLLRPRMASGHLQGRMLKMFVKMIRPRQILEIGTYSGYSALCLAEGLSEGGMLHTMINNPRPTRAEVTDIANAIYYRTDALMLSGETAYGKYPVDAVKTMTKIAAQAEKDKLEENDIRIPLDENSNDVTAFLAKQAVKATSKLKIRAIITDSYSGRTARNLAAFRGKYPVLAICYKEKTMRHLALSYGVEAIYMPELANGQEYYFAALRRLLKEGRLQPTDMVGYLSSGKEGTQTSFLEINVVEDALKHAEDTVLPNNNRYL